MAYRTTQTRIDDLQDVTQAYDQLKNGDEYIATYRNADVATGNTAIDLYVGNPSNSGVDALVVIGLGVGGTSHIDSGEGASVGTSGTDLTVQAKGTGTGTALTIEQGGTYSSSNTINTIAPGSRRGNQPAAATGSRSTAKARLLEPGDALQVTVTNKSGNTVDYDAVVDVTEIVP